MSAIILILILAVWFFVVFKLAGFCVSKMKFGTKRSLSRLFLCVMLFLAPVADDIAGGFQFRVLCSSDRLLVFDESKLIGKTLLWSGETKKTIKGTILAINEYKVRWVDITTRETLLEKTEYHATGGWLSRSIAFNSVTSPYTFKGECDQEAKIDRLAKELKFERKYK